MRAITARYCTQRRGELPARRQLYVGLYRYPARVIAGRIKHHGVPLQAEDFRSRDDASLLGDLRRGELKLDIDMIGAGWYFDMKCIHVDRITAPRQSLAAGCDHQAGKQIDRAVGSMGAWQPLRIEERQRTRFHRHGLAHHEQPAIQIGQIDAQGQRTGIADILRRGNFGPIGRCRAGQPKQRDGDQTL